MSPTSPTAAADRPALDAAGPDQPTEGTGSRLHRFAADLIGATDGIITVAGIVIGVAGAAVGRVGIGLAGLAGLLGGAVVVGVADHLAARRTSDGDRAATPATVLRFLVGAALPLLIIMITAESVRVPVTFAVVSLALVLIGLAGARTGAVSPRWAILRTVLGGAIAMTLCFLIGRFVSTL